MVDSQIVTAKNVDLGNCDREQIQYPAATLDHGLLLVLKEPELTVIQVGANAGDFLGCGPDQVLERPIGAWLDPDLLRLLRETMAHNSLDGPPTHLGRAAVQGREVDVFVHRSGGATIVELEARPEGSVRVERDLYAAVHAAIARLQHAPSLQNFLDLAVVQIREFTGFDRVMAYQFLEDGSGAVRAESVAGGWESFLGLHYPASDIPLPARRLFKMIWLRHQPHIGYTPVPIVPERNPLTGEPLDLSFALLRSVSVMYSQYLKNMGTESSMVMTLLKNGELWGLIACHHHSGPRQAPFEVRAACEFLAHMVSLLLAAKEDQEDYEYRLKLQTNHAHLVRALGDSQDIGGALMDRNPGLLDYIEAGGAALVLHGRPILLGETPQAEEVQRLVEWLASTAQPGVFSTDCLSSFYPEAAAYTGAASGVLATRIASSREDYILWFRPELRRTVNWAGDPKKPVDISADGQRLMPRTSFAIWTETVRNKCRPWRAVELEAARDLRGSLLEIASGRADKLQVLYEDLQRSTAELDAFAYIASHDLKEPLRGIHNYSHFLLEDVADLLPPEGVEKLRTVVRLSRRMDDLLNSLLHYARSGRQGMNVAPCDLNKLVAEALDTLAVRIAESGAETRVAADLPVVAADWTRMSEVFVNLIANALKYNDKPHKLVEIGVLYNAGGPLFYVRDNGIGIAPEFQETIFAIFRRLHPPERFGGGTGAGLTITRKILERHDGRIWVESKPGEGSTFYFTIGKK
jgi:chemotaxis family two-component system sensor kinase Cph1